MQVKVARSISSAACEVYMFKHGLIGKLRTSKIRIVRDCSIAQIETATDVVDAENAATRTDLTQRITATLERNAIRPVKEFADTLNIEP